jgi:hypothetical protein
MGSWEMSGMPRFRGFVQDTGRTLLWGMLVSNAFIHTDVYNPFHCHSYQYINYYPYQLPNEYTASD